MSKVRQMSLMYLRGSIANITMRELPLADQRRSERLALEISDHPALQGHRSEFVYRLSTTIACDYKDDRENATEEFRLAIWKGVIHTFYHCEYTFKCGACGRDSYQSSSRGHQIAINRKQQRCPACGMTKIAVAGDSGYAVGEYVDYTTAIDVAELLRTRSETPPKLVSPILSIPGKRKVSDPNAVENIMNDPVQLTKLFGTFVWSYFRQLINENKIFKTEKRVRQQTAPADFAALDMVKSMLKEHKIDFEYAQNDNPRNGFHTIFCDLNAVPPATSSASYDAVVNGSEALGDCLYHADPAGFFPRLWALRHDMIDKGVEVNITGSTIAISDCCGSATCIDYTVVEQCEVQVAQPITNDEGYDTISTAPDPVNDFDDLETVEALDVARDGLSKECKDVFDLFIGRGEIFQKFITAYPNAICNRGMPNQSLIARFLGCGLREIRAYKELIGARMRAVGAA